MGKPKIHILVIPSIYIMHTISYENYIQTVIYKTKSSINFPKLNKFNLMENISYQKLNIVTNPYFYKNWMEFVMNTHFTILNTRINIKGKRKNLQSKL